MNPNETLRLHLAAEPESVGVARRAVNELAEGLGMREPGLGDLKTVVTEASSNLVRQADVLGSGVFEIEARPIEGEMKIVVRDFRPRQRSEISEGSIGLGLISVLSDHYEVSGHDGGGTEIRIALSLQR